MKEKRPLVEVDEDFGNMMISAIRYGFWRRTYITGLTSDYVRERIKENCFSPRVLSVMDEDLKKYKEDRVFRVENGKGEWFVDDECDFQAWDLLHSAVRDKIKEMKGNGLWPE